MNTPIRYTGELTISVKDKKHIARNNGSYKLFNLIVELLNGSAHYTRPSTLPKYLTVVKTDGKLINLTDTLLAQPTIDSKNATTILNRFVPLSITATEAKSDATIPNIVFEATLTQDMFVNGLVLNDSWTQLCALLVAGNKDDILAVVPLETTVFMNITGATVAEVRWTLTFANSEKEGN